MATGTKARYLMACLFFLIPLSYSIDDDPYRAWEVLFWGGVTVLLALTMSLRIRNEPEFIVIFTYSAVLILQQIYLPDGRFWFGAQYALVFAAAMLPSFVLRWFQWSAEDLNRCWDAAVKVLSAVILINVMGGRFLGWGELYVGGQLGGRYFGYLGDSIAPVLLFPLIYFVLERRYAWAALVFGALMLTGGKTAMLMLVAAPFMVVVARMRPLKQFFAICGVVTYALSSETVVNDLIGLVSNDPLVSYSLNTRLLSYQVGLEYFMSSPIWGVGINQSMLDIWWHADTLARWNLITEYWPVYQVHNAFIRALAETGILGFVVLVALCVILVRRALNALYIASECAPSRPRSIVIAGGVWTVLFIVAYQSTGWFEHGHPQFAWLLIIASLTCVGARVLMQPPSCVDISRGELGRKLIKSGV